jgi:acetyl-CoA acyltransferase
VNDVHVAEVHDCFSIAELLMCEHASLPVVHCYCHVACCTRCRYEAIGLAPHGKGASVAKDGTSHLEGKLPVNTGGGLMSFGHPVGATGVKQLHEIYRQMKGQCGAYQLKKTPGLGLTVNMGGDDKTIVAMMLKNC